MMARDITFDILARDRASKTFDAVGRSTDGLGKKLGGIAKSAGLAAAAIGAAAVAGGVKFGMDALNAASDLNETVNKSTVIFGKNASAIDSWASTASRSMGLSKQAALEAAAGFGDMFLQLGFANDKSAEMSKSVVQMAADLGSFNNLPTAQVADMISSAFRGEYDSLQRLIPNINAARVESEAMRLGLIKNTVDVRKLSQARESQSLAEKRYAEVVKEHGKGSDEARRAALTLSRAQDSVAKATRGAKGDISAQAKAQAALSIIQKDGKRAAGDFAKTSDGLANQQKILKAEFENVKAEVGKELLPVMTRLGKWFLNDGLPAIKRFGGWIKGDLWPALQKGYQTIMPALQSALKIISGGVGDNTMTWKKFGDFITGKVIPTLSFLAKTIIPVVASSIRLTIESAKAAVKPFQFWGEVSVRVASMITRAIAGVMDMFAGMLRALSRVPGFGWAKTAADKMQNAANKARLIADNIRAIPNSKTVSVTTMYYEQGNRSGRRPIKDNERAGGGPVIKGQPYIVGEREPELFIPEQSGRILNQRQMRAASGGSAVGAGGDTYIFNVSGIVGNEQAVVDKLHTLFLQKQRRSGVSLGLSTP